MGNDVTVVVAALAVSLALFLAGAVLALCLIKYNLFLPLPLLIAGRRLWRFGSGVLVGGAFLVGVSFAAGGWGWPAQYILMLRLPTTTPDYQGMPNLHGLLSRLPHGGLLEAGAACMVLGAAWLVMRTGGIHRPSR
jgi:hypothetical protein